MSKSYMYIVLSLMILGTMACEDPIDVELDQVAPQVVVDAWIDNTPNTQTIILSESVPFFDSTSFVPITDASVVVRSSSGAVINFEHETDGNYTFTPDGTIGQIGETLTLTIEHGDVSYTSETRLNRVPVIDSIRTEFVDDDPFNDDGIFAQFISRDLIGLNDTYWIKTFKDGRFFNRPEEINIAWDAGFDSGGEVDGLVFIPPVRFLTNEVNEQGGLVPWEIGEVCRVEIHSISNDAFGFLETLRDQLLNGNNGIFAEPLANTRGNITASDGSTVLGVFNVAAISSLELLIE